MEGPEQPQGPGLQLNTKASGPVTTVTLSNAAETAVKGPALVTCLSVTSPKAEDAQPSVGGAKARDTTQEVSGHFGEKGPSEKRDLAFPQRPP